MADLYNKFNKKDVASKAIEYLKSEASIKVIETNQICFSDSWDFCPSFVKNDKNKLGALGVWSSQEKDETCNIMISSKQDYSQ